MKALMLNGSPRANGNTALTLEKKESCQFTNFVR